VSVVLGSSSLGAVLACTPWEHPAAADERSDPACTPTSPEAQLPVITTLITRDHEVTVYASDDGLRFTVKLADGSLLGRRLTAHELEQSFPALRRRFDASFAGEELWLDASWTPAVEDAAEGSR
jgi:hypothetical protein